MSRETEEMLMSADHPVIENAPPGAILRPYDDPEEGTAVDNNAQQERIEYTWSDPVTGQERHVGNAAAAGRRCITEESPTGVNGHQYRRMVRKPPVTFEAPPGPVEVQGMLLMDPASREYLYDLDEVTAWNNRRPGRGKRGKWRSRKGREQASSETEPETEPEPGLATAATG